MIASLMCLSLYYGARVGMRVMDSAVHIGLKTIYIEYVDVVSSLIFIAVELGIEYFIRHSERGRILISIFSAVLTLLVSVCVLLNSWILQEMIFSGTTSKDMQSFKVHPITIQVYDPS